MADYFQESTRGFQEAIYRTRKEKEAREERFLSDINVDPVSVMTNSAMEKQMNKINQFNDNWIKNFDASNGDLSVQNRVKMSQDKNSLLSWQDKQAKALQDWQRSYDLIRDPRTNKNLDLQYFEDQTQRFKDSDEIPSGGFIRSKAKTLDELSGFVKPKGDEFTFASQRGQKEIKTTVPLGSKFKTMQEAIANAETITRRNTEAMILNDESYLRGAMDYFTSLPDDEQLKYHQLSDINNDGIYDESEKYNAIIMAAQDYVVQKGGTGVTVKEDMLQGDGGFSFGFSRDKKSQFGNVIDLQSNFFGKRRGIKVTGKGAIEIPSKLIKDADGKPVEYDGQLPFIVTNILENDMVEGTVTLPGKTEEIEISQAQAENENQADLIIRGDKIFLKKKSPGKEYTTIVPLSDIDSEIKEYLPGIDQRLKELGIGVSGKFRKDPITKTGELGKGVTTTDEMNKKSTVDVMTLSDEESFNVDGYDYSLSEMISFAKEDKANKNKSDAELARLIRKNYGRK